MKYFGQPTRHSRAKDIQLNVEDSRVDAGPRGSFRHETFDFLYRGTSGEREQSAAALMLLSLLLDNQKTLCTMMTIIIGSSLEPLSFSNFDDSY